MKYMLYALKLYEDICFSFIADIYTPTIYIH